MTTTGPDISLGAPWPGPPLSHLLSPCDRPIVFAGAGVSAGCGLPTGAQLASWLRAQAFAGAVDFSPLDANGRGGHPGYVAGRIFDVDPTARLPVLEAVADHFRAAQSRATYSRVVRAIARTPTGVVLTLNYDTLVEDAAHACGRPVQSLLLADVPELINDHMVEPDGTLRVVHLHGIATEPGTLVLDHRSYMQQANDGQVQNLFVALVAGHNLCAIGTQFEEDYLGTVMLQRRPSHPRHVIVCDVDLAGRVRADTAGIGAERHNWLPCSYAVGEYRVLDPFCEHLVTCGDGSPSGGPLVAVADAVADTVYAPRRLLARDEVERESALPVELQIEFGELDEHGEGSLEREQLAIIVGPPGSGKTRLLQEVARRPRAERALFLRLRDVRDVVGEPESLLRRWLDSSAVLTGEPVSIGAILAGQVRVWLLLDALDEVPLERRRAVAEAVELLARAFPQHRFTVTSRPVAALADLSPAWRVFDLVCDRQWRSDFLQANEVPEGWFWTALEPGGPRLESLLRVPFFLRGAVHLLERGERVADAMQISIALLDQSLGADEYLDPLGGAARRWLVRVALLQQLSGGTSVDDAALEGLAADEGLGEIATLTDLLASRSLLAVSGGRWTFTHRLFGEALAAEHLLGQPPEPWLDSVAPAVGEWSAVLDQWSATMHMVLFRSAEWRRQVHRRDPLFVARATPRDAPASERIAAASLLWRWASEWSIWLDPMHREPATATDAEIVAGLIRTGDLESLQAEVREGLRTPSRFTRGNAVDVLAAAEVPDIAELLAGVIAEDDDSVVRRSAASAARSLRLTELAEPILRRAFEPADEAEAVDMAAAGIDLSPPVNRLRVARDLAAAGNVHVWDNGHLAELPPLERVTWSIFRAKSHSQSSLLLGRETATLVAQLGEVADRDTVTELGYLAALSKSRDPQVLTFVAEREEAVGGVVRALEEREVQAWEIPRLLGAIPVETLRAAGAGAELLEGRWRPQVVPVTPELRETQEPELLPSRSSGLTAVLELPTPERREELEARAHFDLAPAEELAADVRLALARTLDEWWVGDLREGIRRSGDNAQIEGWAAAVLSFGPLAELTLSDERWVQAATCGWLYLAQRKWLAAQGSQERLDQAASVATGIRSLVDLLRIGAGLDVGQVEERLARTDPADEEANKLREAGEAMAAAAGREGLQRLAAANQDWADVLRPQLARAGVVEAQVAELEILTHNAGEEGRGETFDLSWLTSVRDPRTLPALEEALITAGNIDQPSWSSSVVTAVLRAIENVGGDGAARLLDRVARERPYQGAQFLLENRDRVVQSLLWPSAHAAARSLGEQLRLPVEAAEAEGTPRLSLLGEIGRRLREALEGMDFTEPATAVGARLEPAPLRGGEAGPMPIQVVLADEAVSILGEEVRASGLLGDGYLRIWLSGLAAAPTAATVRVAAVEPGGEVVDFDAEVTHAPIQFELTWSGPQPPAEIAVTLIGA